MIQVTKELVTLNQDIAGQEIGVPVYQIFDDNSPDNVPVIYIQSAVHASEIQGSAVIYRLIKTLQNLKLHAKFILIPNCNPFSRTQRAGEYMQGRYDATTGNNWNRFYHFNKSDVDDFILQFEAALSGLKQAELVVLFKDFLTSRLEAKLNSEWGVNTAQFLNTKLQTFAVQADVVLDLHTGPSATRHIYTPDYLADTAKYFNIENIISIPVDFAGALDEAVFSPWCYLTEQLKEKSVEFNYQVKPFTVELGSQENISLAEAEYDANGIFNYLTQQNLVSGFEQIELNESTVTELSDYRIMFSKHAGMVEYIASPGTKVTKGQVIARVLNSLEFDNDNAITDIVSPATGTVILHYPSAAVQVGTQLFKIAVEN